MKKDIKFGEPYGITVLLALFSLSFLLMPIPNFVPIEYMRISQVLIGIWFWGTGISGYYFLIKSLQEKRKERLRERDYRRIFMFVDVVTSIFDIIFCASIIGLLILIKNRMTSNYIAYVDICLMILSFNGHWIFSRNSKKEK